MNHVSIFEPFIFVQEETLRSCHHRCSLSTIDPFEPGAQRAQTCLSLSGAKGRRDVRSLACLVNRMLGRRSPIIDIEHMQLFSKRSIRYFSNMPDLSM